MAPHGDDDDDDDDDDNGDDDDAEDRNSDNDDIECEGYSPLNWVTQKIKYWLGKFLPK